MCQCACTNNTSYHGDRHVYRMRMHRQPRPLQLHCCLSIKWTTHTSRHGLSILSCLVYSVIWSNKGVWIIDVLVMTKTKIQVFNNVLANVMPKALIGHEHYYFCACNTDNGCFNLAIWWILPKIGKLKIQWTQRHCCSSSLAMPEMPN